MFYVKHLKLVYLNTRNEAQKLFYLETAYSRVEINFIRQKVLDVSEFS